jgi:hypothetical protein
LNYDPIKAVGFSPVILKLLPWMIETTPTRIPDLNFGDQEFLGGLRRHHLTPWMYRLIKSRGSEKTVPLPVLKCLQHDYGLALKQALLQDNQADSVLRVLTAAGLEVILLKGADFRGRLYGDPAVRPMADLDLLIPKTKLNEAKAVLTRLGYGCASDSHDLRPGFRERFRASIHLVPQDKGLMLDVHWQIEAVANLYRLP